MTNFQKTISKKIQTEILKDIKDIFTKDNRESHTKLEFFFIIQQYEDFVCEMQS